MKPWIDEGHGGADGGATGGGYYEDGRNLTVGNLVEALCRARGWTTGDTRDIDAAQTLESRSDRANAFGADAFVSIHHDWSGGQQAVIYPNSNNARETASQKLAACISKHIDPLAPTGSITYADRRGLSVLKRTKMPAVIVEVARVQDPYDKIKMAQAIVNGMAEYYGEEVMAMDDYDLILIHAAKGPKAQEVTALANKLGLAAVSKPWPKLKGTTKMARIQEMLGMLGKIPKP